MGSFNATCIVSGLAIQGGDEVRFLTLARSAFHPDGNDHVNYVGGRWQIHGVPIRAVYDDYGSVEDVEENLTSRIFFEALKRGAVEKGVGDNTVHDVEVRGDMDQKGWLKALWEGRVFVEDHKSLRTWDPEKYEPSPGIPSIRRITAALKEGGHSIAESYGAEGYIVDEVKHGFIRVRYGAHRGNDDTELEAALPAIHAAGFAAMVTAGSGNYANHGEVLVGPKPSSDPSVHIFTAGLADNDRSHDPRPVSQAMIREDVWQILLDTKYEGWSGNYTRETMTSAALEAVKEELAWRAQKAEIMALAEGEAKVEAVKGILRRELDMINLRSGNLFLDSLRGHEGTSGFSFREEYRLGVELSQDPEELERYVRDVAEALHVEIMYGYLHGQWHPSTNSDQEGRWEEAREFRAKLVKLCDNAISAEDE